MGDELCHHGDGGITCTELVGRWLCPGPYIYITVNGELAILCAFGGNTLDSPHTLVVVQRITVI